LPPPSASAGEYLARLKCERDGACIYIVSRHPRYWTAHAALRSTLQRAAALSLRPRWPPSHPAAGPASLDTPRDEQHLRFPGLQERRRAIRHGPLMSSRKAFPPLRMAGWSLQLGARAPARPRRPQRRFLP
jgi:hypothetical protein